MRPTCARCYCYLPVAVACGGGINLKLNLTDMDSHTQLALAQLIGFAHGKRGYDVESLIDSMGLQESEWEELKDESIGLTDAEKQEINNYFNNK